MKYSYIPKVLFVTYMEKIIIKSKMYGITNIDKKKTKSDK